MQIDFKGTNYEPTEQIIALMKRRVSSVEKFLGRDRKAARAYVDLGREGDENQQGNVWYVDISVDAGGERYYARAQRESIEMALDEVVNDVCARIRGARGKKETLTRRGGAFIKSLMQRG